MPTDDGVSRRRFLYNTVAATAASTRRAARAAAAEAITLECQYFRYVIGSDGRNSGFIGKQSGMDYLLKDQPSWVLTIAKRGHTYPPASCSYANGKLLSEFPDAGVRLVCDVGVHASYLTIAVSSVEGDGVDQITLSNLRLHFYQHVSRVLNGGWDDRFAAAVLALNLKTNAAGQSSDEAVMWSACYSKLGLIGAKIALLGCPTDQLRPVIKEVVTAERLWHSDLGGAWALDTPQDHYSYLIGTPAESRADDWVRLAQSSGAKELQMLSVVGQGHFNPAPTLFPDGIQGLKSAVLKTHQAGLLASLHTLSFVIDKSDPYVRPTPDKRLAARATLTLAGNIGPEADSIPTIESPAKLPSQSNYWSQGGSDILVDDEILTYSSLQTTAPYGLRGCRRGVNGTHAAPHAKGAKLQNLQQVFNMYVPDPDSTLFDEVAQHLADVVNTCNFDKIYFDALDGAGIFAGPDWRWYYGARFALSVYGRVKRPVQVESAASLHHLWHITSLFGALDSPSRGVKAFIDLHIEANNRINALIPTQLGWFTFYNYNPPGAEGDYARCSRISRGEVPGIRLTHVA